MDEILTHSVYPSITMETPGGETQSPGASICCTSHPLCKELITLSIHHTSCTCFSTPPKFIVTFVPGCCQAKSCLSDTCLNAQTLPFLEALSAQKFFQERNTLAFQHQIHFNFPDNLINFKVHFTSEAFSRGNTFGKTVTHCCTQLPSSLKYSSIANWVLTRVSQFEK